MLTHMQYGRGQDVIFLHGWGGDKRSLRGIAEAFQDEFRVTLVDFYGFGETPHPSKPLVLEDYAQAVTDIINRYRMQDVILVGHSFGGRVAMLLAAHAAHLLHAVVLLGAAGVKPRRSLAYRVRVLKHKLHKKYGVGKPQAGSADYRALSGAMRGSFVNIVNEHLDAHLAYITLPVLLVYGENDKDTPLYMARRIKRKVKNARLLVIKGAGHYAHIEKRAEVTAAVKDFLGEVSDA